MTAWGYYAQKTHLILNGWWTKDRSYGLALGPWNLYRIISNYRQKKSHANLLNS
jgi:hypothetical protein